MNVTTTDRNGPRYFVGITTEELQKHKGNFALSFHARQMVKRELMLREVENALATLQPNHEQ